MVESEIFKAQAKNHIKTQLEPYLNEFEEIKNNPEISKDFLMDWLENFVWAVKDSTK